MRAPTLARLLFCALLAPFAVGAANDTARYRHTAWPVERGAPADIWALAQGRDGYLWLGTGDGLYRFDGVTFERLAPGGDALATRNITALRFAADGTLWLGFFYGGVAALKDGALRRYGAQEGFPDGMVIALAQTRDGALWAASRGGLVRYDGTRWQVVGADRSYPSARADWAFVDRAGTLWVTTGETLVRLPEGALRFEDTGVVTGKNAVLAQAPDGVLWLSDGLHGTRALPGLDEGVLSSAAVPSRTNHTEAKRLLFDRSGALWGTDAASGGVYRIDRPAAFADGRSLAPDDLDGTLRQADGLTADIAVPLLEDAEGTVWTGTNLGLNSFHVNNVTSPDSLRAGATSSLALAATDGDGAWVVNHGLLLRAKPDGETIERRDLPDVYSAVRGAPDELWLQAHDVLLRVHGGIVTRIALPEGLSTDDTRALAPDRNGGIWAGFSRHGVRHWRDGAWTTLEPDPALRERTPTALAVDGAERLWIGYTGGAVARVDASGTRVYGKADGLDIGVVTVIEVGGDALLIGGETGVARQRGERFQPLAIAAPELLAGVSGIARTRNGDLWINAIRGVVRVEAAQAERAFAARAVEEPAVEEPAYRAAHRLFDYRDGLAGVARQATVTSTAIVDAADHVWLLTNQGIARIDPGTIRTNFLRPAVMVGSLDADGRRYAAANGLHLPAGTNNARIAYTATSLAVPDRVAFRYRLDGVDTQWQEAGGRREGFYTNLGPGDYRFRVIAANDDGTWNDEGATFAFTIEPWFHQTAWFYAACALAAVMLVALLYGWRMRRVADRISLRFSERMGERERIARELHDTLLQGVQGLLLRLQVFAAGLPSGDTRRPELDDALEQAREMLVEGRDRIVALRVGDTESETFGDALRALGEALRESDATALRVTVTGDEKPLCPPVCEEILDIVREGVRNAFQHAQATTITVAATFERRALRVRIADDGTGIDERVLEQGRREGHWGLVGMRERAARLGARIDIRRVRPRGTEVTLTVPAKVVFGPKG